MQTFSSSQKILAAAGVLILMGVLWLAFRPVPARYPFLLADTPKEWTFAGSDADNGPLEAQTRARISELDGQIGKTTDSDYSLLISIAGRYDRLGDGKKEYEYLTRALANDPTFGLAWHNLGALLARLNAPKSARKAYEESVKAEPNELQYSVDLLRFETAAFPADTAAIEADFAAEDVRFGENAALLQVKAEWYGKTGRTQEAEVITKRMKALVAAHPLTP